MKKTYVRLLFLILLASLAFEVFLSFKGIEPYPAPVYPEFSTVNKNREAITIIKPDFVVSFAEGDSQFVDYFQLFSLVPISHVNHVVVNSLNPIRRFEPSKYQDKPFKKFQLGRFTIEWRRTPWLPSPDEIEHRNDFFKDRIHKVTGRTNPQKIDITWYEYDFVFGEGLKRESKRPVYDSSYTLVGGEKR